jgi:tetratricopeptide (TPR) repeat protein
MTDQPTPENRLVCPNCSSLNSLRAVICSSCGVKIEDFRAALPRLQQLKDSRTASQREKLDNEKTIQIEKDAQTSRRSFRKLLLFLMTGIFMTGLVISVGAILYASRVKQNQAELKAHYEVSIVCLENEKYLCARDGFEALVVAGADFPYLIEYLNGSQYGLAKQYFESGQWEKAIIEFDTLLRNDPGNQDAIASMKISYDRWVDQLGVEGKWLKKWMVRRELDLRFPPGDE